MKKIWIFVLFIFFVASIINPVYGAEYRVRKGDNLTKIAELTGHTVEELVAMNRVKNPDIILVGQKIKFLGEKDIASAVCYSFDKANDWPNWDNSKWERILKTISTRINYGPDKYDGCHFSDVLEYAKDYRSILFQERIQFNRNPYKIDSSHSWGPRGDDMGTFLREYLKKERKKLK